MEALGAFAVSAMVLFYALEKAHSLFVLLFAGACALSALYAYFLGSYPFLVAETIWAAIALKRWLDLRRAAAGAETAD